MNPNLYVSYDKMLEFLKIHNITYKEFRCAMALTGKNYVSALGYNLYFPYVGYRRKKIKVILG